jgi:hypothetical protein
VVGFAAPESLELGLVEAQGVDYDLDHVVLGVPEPDQAFDALSTLGFSVANGRLRAGGEGNAYVELEPGPEKEIERPLLNHLGLRVESTAEHLEEARQRGLEIADIVDAANTYAVFVWGPGRIKLEYVEHKESFSLV